MVARRAFWTLALLTAAFAGCLSEDASTDDTDGEPVGQIAGDDTGSVNETFQFSITLGAAGPTFYAYPPYVTEGPFGGQVKIEDGAASISAESAWSCMSGPVCELALAFFRDDEFVVASEGMGPLSLEVTDPKPGIWTVTMFASANGAVVVQAAGDIDVVVAYGAGIEESEDAQSEGTA